MKNLKKRHSKNTNSVVLCNVCSDSEGKRSSLRLHGPRYIVCKREEEIVIKKTYLAIAVMALALGITACSSKPEETTAPSEETTQASSEETAE